jgi:hypothetical protein
MAQLSRGSNKRFSPQSRLTTQSRGRPQAGFAHLRPPLTSNVRRFAMQPIVVIAARELEADPSARLWALAIHLAEHVGLRELPQYRHFWLAYLYDAEVQNGGHLQYFHNQGTKDVPETLTALREIGANSRALILEDCWRQMQDAPVQQVSSLSEYSSLAAERSFKAEDSAYYDAEPDVLSQLEVHFESLLASSVAVSA